MGLTGSIIRPDHSSVLMESIIGRASSWEGMVGTILKVQSSVAMESTILKDNSWDTMESTTRKSHS